MRWNQRLIGGMGAGLIGGVLLAAYLMGSGLLPRLPALAEVATVQAGWALVLLYGAILGILFGMLVGGPAFGLLASLLIGLGYGVAAWMVVALTLQPLATRRPPGWSISGLEGSLDSLPGYLVLGAVTGLLFTPIARWVAPRPERPMLRAARVVAVLAVLVILVAAVFGFLGSGQDLLSTFEDLQLPRGGGG